MKKFSNKENNLTTQNYIVDTNQHNGANIMNTTHGFNAGELVVIAARPGCGKTTIALNLAVIAQCDNKVIYESLEMTSLELQARKNKFSDTPCSNLYIDDNPEKTIDDIEQDIKKIKPAFVFIDYLQLLNDPIRTATKRLKAIAKKYQVVIVVLAQLNRKAQTETPTLAMLKDSGTIEQDADQVGFITENDLHIAKNRKGPTAIIPIGFRKEFSLIIEDLDKIEHNTILMGMLNQMCSNTSLFHYFKGSRKIKKFDFGFGYRHIKCKETIPYIFVAQA